MERCLLRRFALAATLAALLLAASGSRAVASVTIGQLDPGATASNCTIDFDRLQPTVTSGNSYIVPDAGTITSWTTKANANAGRELTMKVFRKVGEPDVYQVVGHAGPQPLTPGGTAGNTFPANVPVKPGDVLGLYTNTTNSACAFEVPGDRYFYKQGNLADGASDPFIFFPNLRLNISAVLVPDNTFTLGALTRNKKKGRATLTVTVPNPGELTGSGKGVNAAAAGATISKAVTAGATQLLIKAKGKKKRKLNETGKVKLNVLVTYRPTNGDPATQSIKVKLKKKL